LSLKAAPNYESLAFDGNLVYQVQVKADDGINTANQKIAVTIADVEEAVSIYAQTPAFVNEGSTLGTFVEVTDLDNQDQSYFGALDGSLTFTGPDANAFEQYLSAGALLFKQPTDYETKSVYNVTIEYKKARFDTVTKKDIVINILDVNDNAPIFTSNAAVTIDENTTAVTTLETTDADTSQEVTYSISGGADADKFNLSSSGALSLKAAPNYESLAFDGNLVYQVQVKADDGINTANQKIAVTIADVEEAVSIYAQTPAFVNEGSTLGTFVEVTDLDNQDQSYFGALDGSLTFTGPDANAFEQYLSAGALLFKQPTDYETKSVYNVTIEYKKARFDTVTKKDIVINILDVNDNAPIFTSNAAVTIDENTTAVTTLETTDADTSQEVTYSITGGADADDFAVDQATGALTLKVKPDFESGKTSYAVKVEANDGVNSTDQTITVSVNDLNDNAPVFADANYDITIVENTKGPTLLETTDVDTNPEVTYSLSGADAADFEIVNDTLALKEAADFESGKTAYAVTVTASDGLNSTTQAVTYTITDANDNAPVFTSNAAY